LKNKENEEKMRISILGSGSSGNSIFIETNGVKFLIDAGFSGKRMEEKLISIGEKIENIRAILITHEHGDHISGAGILSRKYGIPIYITEESYEICSNKIGKVEKYNLNFIEKEFFIEDTKIIPFDVMHDATRTIGFRIEASNGKKIAVATDIGYIDNIVRNEFQNVDIMVIETNYDYNMLMKCSYPWDLKARVKGKNGHLSNNDAARFIKEMYHENLKKVYLVHVSKDSNSYELAFDTVEEELRRCGHKIEIEISYQDIPTKIYEI
jgi:phosphoribosyl 1,2-cyclic phosphodiesterase